MKKIKINKKVLKIAKWSTIVGGAAFMIQAAGKIEIQRQEAVIRANTFSAMFGSLANYVGDDMVAGWNEQMAAQNPEFPYLLGDEDSSSEAPPEESQGLADRLELPASAEAVDPEPLVMPDAREFAVSTDGEVGEVVGKHEKDTIEVMGD